MIQGTIYLFMLLLSAGIFINADKIEKDNALRTDLDASGTSAKLFNLGSLFGQNPNYPYGYNGYYPQNTYNRPYYPSNGYYPSTGWTGNNYYPNYGYPSSAGGYYPSSGGYYPTTGGYYPPSGTNILGSSGGYGGYGGYGGNGGLRQYNGYWNPDYTGQRNRGFGYFSDTDRFGLPQRSSSRNEYGSYGPERDRLSGGYRGYN